jgi:hypothetical protein
MNLPKIYDLQGDEQGWDWLVAAFGAVRLERAEVPEGAGRVFRVVRLQAVEGTAMESIHVLDQDGDLLEGVTVVRTWPDAPPLPGWSPPASRWRECGVYGITDAKGEIGFGMGHGDTYIPPSGGPSAVWVAEEVGPSDLIDGLGMLEGERQRHLNVTFQLQDAGEGAPPSPPLPSPSAPDPLPTRSFAPPPSSDAEYWERISEKLDRILELLERQSRDP